MLSDDFWTIAGPGMAQLRVLGSRFSATAFPIDTEDELHATLENAMREHYDATHHCWAMRIRMDQEILQRSSDAGEPKGTAGKPILNEIVNSKLENCAIIVTRWFGGTKLGTGGLARAYGETAARAIHDATRVLRRTGVVVSIATPYELQSQVYHIAGRYGAAVEQAASEQSVRMRVKLRRSQIEQFAADLLEESAGRLLVEEEGIWIS